MKKRSLTLIAGLLLVCAALLPSCTSSKKMKALEAAHQEALAQEREANRKKLEQLTAELEQRNKQLQQVQQSLAEKERAAAALKNAVNEALLGFNSKDLSVNVKDGKVYVSLSEQLLFRSGSTKVDVKGREALQKLAVVLKKQSGVNVVVEGHTDDKALISGIPNMQDNWDLSVLRATEITRILTGAGVDAPRVTPSGRSKFIPVADNSSSENRQKNR
ncbi:MAG: OmpA family protein, partial [Hymenobacteraceae bacterium]|nr:OmpA family protein [Hymenobacteraceae bacterium]MDX5394782.1 OmpA family protein [Hymenobacteraceae bacterium]MDX5510813.1 OmpA family protein [Hymenobacteraceae bacterium]